jgi:hypothetical protein
MSEDPNDMEDKYPIDTPDDLRSIDRAMLLALSHRQRDSTPLSLDHERLLDSWIAGRLPPIDADRAAELTKQNKFAAEHIIERRLIAAANEGPGVPSALAARVLRASRPPKTRAGGIFSLRWPTLSGWQWTGLGAAVTATAAIAVFGFQVWQTRLRPDQSFQIAMVTIEDRSAFSEGARRTRGPQAPAQISANPPESHFQDIVVPTALLRSAITSASTDKGGVKYSELMSNLRTQNKAFNSRARILIDSVLAASLLEQPKERTNIPIRVYDLDDPRAAKIRSKIRTLPADAHFILLTLKQ